MKTPSIFFILFIIVKQQTQPTSSRSVSSNSTTRITATTRKAHNFNRTTKYTLNSKAFEFIVKNLLNKSPNKQLADLDPNIDMSRWNPLKLSANQTAILQSVGQLNQGNCWKNSYTRGTGTVVSYCDKDAEDKEGAICYPKCDEPGYVGIGPR